MLIVGLGREFAEEMVVEIEDVTWRAQELREVLGKNEEEDENLDENGHRRRLSEKERKERNDRKANAKDKFSVEELIELGVMPREVEYVVDEELKRHLKMDGGADS